MTRPRGKRRTRQRLEGELDTLFNSVTLSQLRTVLAALSAGPVRSARTRDEVVEQIESLGRSTDDVRRAIHIVETSAPSKHCLFLWLAPDDQEATQRRLLQSRRRQTSSALTLSDHFAHRDSTFLVFQHDVEVVDWETNEARTQKNAIRRTVRHPMVVRYRTGLPGLTITYPGVSQGSAPQDKRIDYKSLVKSVSDFLAELGIAFKPLPARACINALSEAKSTRIAIVRATSHPQAGRLQVSSADKDVPVEDVLSRFVAQPLSAKGISLEVLKEAFSEAQRNAPVDSLFIHWRRERVFTRLDFWDIGTEFLFVWHDTERDYAITDDIASVLYSVASDIDTPSHSDVWKEVASLANGELILPSEFMSRFTLPEEESRQVLLDALRAGLLQPVYRLHAADNLSEHWVQEWTPRLSDLRRTFIGSDGVTVDGSDPRQIQLAFRRTRSLEADQ